MTAVAGEKATRAADLADQRRVDHLAVDAASQHLPGVPRRQVRAAILAASAVWGEAEQAAIAALVDQVGLREFANRNGVTNLQIVNTVEITQAFIGVAKVLLAEAGPNYAEWEFRDRATGDKYKIYAIRPDGQTPHELRTSAEAEVARLTAELNELRTQMESPR